MTLSRPISGEVFCQRLGCHDIERGAAEMAGIERGDERRLVNERPRARC